ncbi:MAG: hypothetical protein FWE46_04495 [Coriobacteriia bacterium]|nr:hypothetical protein [Coriobacteriia bacterium]MCL2537272.1 hypothetical protein [Coriobacteriia bacterium]
MKKIVLTLAMATCLVLSFSVVAQAKYAGFTPIRSQAELDAGKLQGFITFPEAQAEMARNFGPNGAFSTETTAAALANKAHGGYVSTTTKCAVCHSAHRASGVNPNAAEGSAAGSTGGTNTANVQDQYFLTAGSDSCGECHVDTGGQASTLLVEWGTTPTNGGPHTSRGCETCHNAGIHGLESSDYNVMNAYMLGNKKVNATEGAPTRDDMIHSEIMAGKVLRGGTLDIPASWTQAGGLFDGRQPVVANPVAGSTWWANGTRGVSEVGGVPGEVLGGGSNGASSFDGFPGAPNGNQFAAARGLATAYTCQESGCHESSVMFNLNWGMGFDRTSDTSNGSGNLNSVTGHILPSVRATGGANGNACGPCHAGNSAGFPTASSEPGQTDLSRRAWGCDQCHDMVGVSTNSTAFPHGNRNIKVYEWESDGTQIETTATSGNLWMYGGSIARSATAPNITGNPGAASQTKLGKTSANDFFADNSWRVLTQVTKAPAGATGSGTGLIDGSCLKCHVALDSASRTADVHVGADAIRHTWPANQGGPSNPSWNGATFTSSARLFMYK